MLTQPTTPPHACAPPWQAADMVMHPSPGHYSGTLVNALLHHCQLPAMALGAGAPAPLSLEGAAAVAASGGGGGTAAAAGGAAAAAGDAGVSEAAAAAAAAVAAGGTADSSGGSGGSGPSIDPLSSCEDPSELEEDDEEEGGLGLRLVGPPGAAADGTVRPGIVHRLDRGTTGLLVVAKTDAAHLSLAQQARQPAGGRLRARSIHVLVVQSCVHAAASVARTLVAACDYLTTVPAATAPPPPVLAVLHGSSRTALCPAPTWPSAWGCPARRRAASPPTSAGAACSWPGGQEGVAAVLVLGRETPRGCVRLLQAPAGLMPARRPRHTPLRPHTRLADSPGTCGTARRWRRSPTAPPAAAPRPPTTACSRCWAAAAPRWCSGAWRPGARTRWVHGRQERRACAEAGWLHAVPGCTAAGRRTPAQLIAAPRSLPPTKSNPTGPHSDPQIRVHAKHIGHPLFADDTYSSLAAAGSIVGAGKAPRAAAAQAAARALGRPALHAKTLGFRHPATGEELRFDSELPPDFEAALAALRGPPFAA